MSQSLFLDHCTLIDATFVQSTLRDGRRYCQRSNRGGWREKQTQTGFGAEVY